MNILFVNHTFPPESLAGSEVYVLNLARELKKRGHKVAVLYRYANPKDDEYFLQRGVYEQIPIYKINNTYRFVRHFQDIYHVPAITAKFAAILGEFKPDVVHFNHTTNLSMTLVQESKQRGCRVIYTLHDYWLLCQRGQLLHHDLTMCEGPGLEKCRSCVAPQLLRGMSQRWIHKLTHLFQIGKTREAGNLLQYKKKRVQAPQRSYVGRTCFQMGDGENETLLMHPPAKIRYRISVNNEATFTSAVGLHPSMYDKDGGGVNFEVWQDNTLLTKKTLNPKKNPSDHGWHDIKTKLKPGATHSTIVLRTVAEGDDNRFCTAGWHLPRIENHTPSQEFHYDQTVENKLFLQQRFQKIIYMIAETIAAFSPKANEAIQHRANWVKRVQDQVDCFIAPSRFLRDRYVRFGFPQEKIIYSDYGFVIPQQSSPHDTALPLRFIYLGTWIPSKGVHLAVEAFRTVDPQQAQLDIYGFFPGYDGYETYEAYIRSQASDAVQFKGKYDSDQVYDILSKYDALVMPSIWWENSPLTIHEAFLANVPVLTSNQGGMAELVAEGGGFTFQHRDADSLRYLIMRLIDSPQLLQEARESIPMVKAMPDHAVEMEHIYSSKEI